MRAVPILQSKFMRVTSRVLSSLKRNWQPFSYHRQYQSIPFCKKYIFSSGTIIRLCWFLYFPIFYSRRNRNPLQKYSTSPAVNMAVLRL